MMFLSVLIDQNIREWGVHVSKAFLNHILEEGYQPGEQLFVVSILSPYEHEGRLAHYPVLDIIQEDTEESQIRLPPIINGALNLVDDMYVDVNIANVPVVTDILVTLQGYNESFGKIEDIKDKLATQMQSMRVLNTGDSFMVDNECVEITRITDATTALSLPSAVTVITNEEDEIKITLDFQETKESIIRKEAEEQRKELEARGFIGEGHRLGSSQGTCTQTRDPKEARKAWLSKFK